MMLGKTATVLAGSGCQSHPMQLAQMSRIYISDRRTDVVDESALTEVVKVCSMRVYGIVYFYLLGV
jgi:hypothetical protein